MTGRSDCRFAQNSWMMLSGKEIYAQQDLRNKRRLRSKGHIIRIQRSQKVGFDFFLFSEQ
jgi:hypothetical protein